MRYGLISDVHGNHHALRAVLEALDRQRVDVVVSAGDLVGFGPRPNECVELVADAGVVGVAGNHELIALGRLTDARCGERARASQQWTQQVLRDDVRRYLDQLPARVTLPGLVVTHGSLADPEEYVRSERAAREQLERVAAEHEEADTLVLGHTHRAWVFHGHHGTLGRRAGRVHLRDGRHLVNPGSVGQSRQREPVPLARFAVLDTDHGHVDLHAIDYDVAACRAELRHQGLPDEYVHLRPKRVRGAVSRARGLARRLVTTGSP